MVTQSVATASRSRHGQASHVITPRALCFRASHPKRAGASPSLAAAASPVCMRPTLHIICMRPAPRTRARHRSRHFRLPPSPPLPRRRQARAAAWSVGVCGAGVCGAPSKEAVREAYLLLGHALWHPCGPASRATSKWCTCHSLHSALRSACCARRGRLAALSKWEACGARVVPSALRSGCTGLPRHCCVKLTLACLAASAKRGCGGGAVSSAQLLGFAPFARPISTVASLCASGAAREAA